MKRHLVISGGTYKDKRITCPPGEIRPAMSIMREVLFQVLANMLTQRAGNAENTESVNAHEAFKGLSVVDMFSGSCLIALEFISRGVIHAIAVESDRGKWSVMLKNIALLCDNERQTKTVFLYKDKVERFIVKHKKAHDIIYCDPPFAYAHKSDLMHKIAASALLSFSSIVVIHTPTREKLLDCYGALHKVDARIVGGSRLHFYASCS